MRKKIILPFLSAILLCLVLFAFLPIFTKVNLRAQKSEMQMANVRLYEEPAQKSEAQPLESPLYKIRSNAEASENFSRFPIPKFSAQIAESSLNFEIEKEAAFGISSFAPQSLNEGIFNLKTFEISQLDSVPKRISEGKVEYPESLLKRGIEGQVRALVFINQDGSAELAEFLYVSNEQFKEPVKKLVGTLKFETPLVDGKPVRAKFILPIPFKILK